GPGPMATSGMTVPGIYQMLGYDCEILGVVTNKVPYGAYRGFGSPQGVFVGERMVDILAHHLEIDPAEIRLKNCVRPEQMPFTSVIKQHFDSGDYPGALKMALDALGYEDARAEQRKAREQGRYLGIGMANFIETTASPTAPRVTAGCRTGSWDQAIV